MDDDSILKCILLEILDIRHDIKDLKDAIKGATLDMLVNVPLFNPFPPEFNYTNSDYCYIFVHPGYSISHRIMTKDNKAMTKDNKAYNEYLQNIEQLNKQIKKSGELAIFANETTTFYNKKYEDDLSPPDSALTIITKIINGDIKKYIKTPNGIRKQRMNTIYSFLKDNGIHEVRLAGEYAWYNGNGCLGVVASNFYKEGFNLKGMDGCIYPTTPPEKSNEVLEKLYGDTIKIPFVESRRATE